MPTEPYLAELEVRLAPDRIVDVSPVLSSNLVPDATAKYRVSTTIGDLFLIVSNKASPLLVKRCADRQREARTHLSGHAAEAVEPPIYEGFESARSFAVWSYRQPLSSNRFWRRAQLLWIVPRVFQWLRQVASQTLASANTDTILSALERLQQVPGLPSPISTTARKSANQFRSGEISPILVLQHGDLWHGNILKAPCASGFVIIDWAGARLDGAPFFDLTNFAVSAGASKPRLRSEVLAHSQLLGCSPAHALAYVLAGLGTLHLQLEHFPESRFLTLCERHFYALNNL